MPMEAAAMDKLVDKGEFRPQVTQAIAEAIDITIKAANLATVPMLDARFTALETRLEIRFGSIEKSIESTKVWATLLYAGLTIALFSALAVDHHWLVSREDPLMSQLLARSDATAAEQYTRIDKRSAEQQAQSDARFAEQQTRLDKHFAEQEAQSNTRLAEQQTRMDAVFAQHGDRFDQLLRRSEARVNGKIDQLRTLIINTSKRPVAPQPPPTNASQP